MSVRRETSRMPTMTLFQPLSGAFPGNFAMISACFRCCIPLCNTQLRQLNKAYTFVWIVTAECMLLYSKYHTMASKIRCVHRLFHTGGLPDTMIRLWLTRMHLCAWCVTEMGNQFRAMHVGTCSRWVWQIKCQCRTVRCFSQQLCRGCDECVTRPSAVAHT